MEIIDKIFDSSLIVFVFLFCLIQAIPDDCIDKMSDGFKAFIAIPLLLSLFAIPISGVLMVWLK